MKIFIALVIPFLLGVFAHDAWQAARSFFIGVRMGLRKRGHLASRRIPDPWENEYRRGWLWGVVCGACLGAIVSAVLCHLL